MARMNLDHYRYQDAIIAVVLEGVYDGETTSLIATYGGEDGEAAQIFGAPTHSLVSPPSDIMTGSNPITGNLRISSATGTLVATDSVVYQIMRAHRGQDAFGASFVWDLGDFDAYLDDTPGRHIYRFSGSPPSPKLWHSLTTQFRLVDSGGAQYAVEASTPIPQTLIDGEEDLRVWDGTMALIGRRFLIVEVDKGEPRITWRGFIESWDLSSQQNELEVSAQGPLRILRSSPHDSIDATIVDLRFREDYLEWESQYKVHHSEPRATEDFPGEAAIIHNEGVIPINRTSWDAMPDSGDVVSRDLDEGRDLVGGQVDHGGLQDEAAKMGFAYNLSPPWQTTGIGALTSTDLIASYLLYFYISPRKTDDGVVHYDAAIWHDAIDLDDIKGAEGVPIDHYVIDPETSYFDVLELAAYPLSCIPRLTSDGKLGMARVAMIHPDDLADGIPTHRLLSDRIDLSFPIRKAQATYTGEVGAFVDTVEADEVKVEPIGTGEMDLLPKYVAAEKKLDFSLFHRSSRQEVANILLEYHSFYRIAPIFTLRVRLRDWHGEDESALPPVGSYVRLAGGPLDGVVGPDGKRIHIDDTDVIAIGIVLRRTIRWENRTAETDVLLSHWESGDVMPRVVAPSAVVQGLDGPNTLEIFTDTENELNSIYGVLGFLDGDQVRLYDRSGRAISDTVYLVDSTSATSITLSSSLTSDDQAIVNAWAGEWGRGVVLRLADLSDYENDWTGGDVDLSPSNADRRFSYWAAGDYWVLA